MSDDVADAAGSLRGMIESLVRAWLSADHDAVGDAVTEDVVAIGPGPQDVHVGRDALVHGVRQHVPRRRDTAAQPLAVHVGLAGGGRSGWGWALGTDPAGRSVRATVAGTQDGGSWRADHAHLSFGLPNAQLGEYSERRPTLAPVGDDVTPAAAELVALLKESWGARRLNLIADRPDAVVIGTDPQEVYEGGATYRATFEPMLPQIQAMEQGLRCEYPGGLCGRLTSDGQTGFVAGNVLATFGEESLPPFRLGWIFTEVDGDFRLVVDHHSAAAG